jgi:DNA repair exonuclease SbcCD nuclease subunit
VHKGEVHDEKLTLKFTVDKKTGVKITGILGKRGMLEHKYYEKLNKENLEKEEGFKIFMFHSPISELKPKDLEQMDSFSLDAFPKGFDYYAGGHVHICEKYNTPEFKNVYYPGPLFPANFAELEKLKSGFYCMYENGEVKRESITIKKVVVMDIDAKDKTPGEVEQEIKKNMQDDYKDMIVLLKAHGRLQSGKASNIDFNSIIKELYDKNAYFVMKNASKLLSQDMQDIKITEKTIEDVEQAVIKENLGQIKTGFSDREAEIAKLLIAELSKTKKEDQKVQDFQEKLKEEGLKILDIEK